MVPSQRRWLWPGLVLWAACAHASNPLHHNPLVREEPSWRVAEMSFRGFDPPASSEAKVGLDLMLAGGDFFYGLPEKYYRELMEVGAYTPNQMWLFGHLPSPPGRDVGGLPYLAVGHSLSEYQGSRQVAFNCLTCHAGAAAGQVVAGLPNNNFDAFTLLTMSRAMVVSYDNPASREAMTVHFGAQSMESIRGSVEYARSLVYPSFGSFPVRGDNPGAYVLWRINARLADPAHSVAMVSPGETTTLERELFGGTFVFPPIEPMPWWNLKYKRRAYWTQDGDNRSPVTFALNEFDHHPGQLGTLEARLERTARYLDFARSTQAPPFPDRARVDRERAAVGRELFHGQRLPESGHALRCAACHGTYDATGALESYPELPNQNVGTDPAYVTTLMGFKQLYDRTDQLYARFKGTPYYPADGDHAIRYPDRIGYAAPPLVGIWASGPYFHNGSVPTVRAVLSSSARPAIWMKSLDPWSYDAHDLGVVVEQTLTAADYEQRRRRAAPLHELNTDGQLDFRRIYDTAQYGRSSAGHPFGDTLTDDERTDVLEFLKLL